MKVLGLLILSRDSRFTLFRLAITRSVSSDQRMDSTLVLSRESKFKFAPKVSQVIEEWMPCMSVCLAC